MQVWAAKNPVTGGVSEVKGHKRFSAGHLVTWTAGVNCYGKPGA